MLCLVKSSVNIGTHWNYFYNFAKQKFIHIF